MIRVRSPAQSGEGVSGVGETGREGERGAWV